jgi:hypothetical protein
VQRPAFDCAQRELVRDSTQRRVRRLLRLEMLAQDKPQRKLQ